MVQLSRKYLFGYCTEEAIAVALDCVNIVAEDVCRSHFMRASCASNGVTLYDQRERGHDVHPPHGERVTVQPVNGGTVLRRRGDGQVVHHVYFVMVMIISCGDLRGCLCFAQYPIGGSAIGVGRAMSQIRRGVYDCVVGIRDKCVRVAQMGFVVLWLGIVESSDEVHDHRIVSLVCGGVRIHAVRLAKRRVGVAIGVSVGVGVNHFVCVVHCFVKVGFVNRVCGIGCREGVAMCRVCVELVVVVDPGEDLFKKLRQFDFGRERLGIKFEEEEVVELPNATDGDVHLTASKILVAA